MRQKLGILALTTVAVLGASLVAAPADAGHRHKHRQKHGHKHNSHPSAHRFHAGPPSHGVHPRHGRVEIGHLGHRPFVVPRHIPRGAHRAYRPYYLDQVYFRPHRHHHAVYRFPVHTRHGTIWRKHYYCKGDIYWGGPHHHYRSGVGFQIRF